MKAFLFVLIIFVIFTPDVVFANDIPDWVKNNAKWWAEDQISDDEFVTGLEFLVNNDLIKVSQNQMSEKSTDKIPDWIKNNAKWWADGNISDREFLNGIEFLISHGIVSVNKDESPAEFFDLKEAGPYEGLSDAPVMIIMFSDYQCEKCAQWILHEKEILNENVIDKGKAKFYVLDYPLLGDDSITAAEAVYCAEEQGKYDEYHKILALNYNGIQTGWANFDSLVEYAKQLNLDINKFEQCLYWDKNTLRVEYNKQVAQSQGIVGTPSFIVVSETGEIKKINGPQPSMIFERVISEFS
ncbi:hypothetical protein C6988_05685 [Nitrosopumilus sp. b1]|uniref:DsbA family protein n=1 Tax=Nitrosopumilus sp. b1 TaxID=2109907 RepID=UPI0015F619AC|nr:thioredoxin domain-containing protein [Nitrosopumilus sp. b1]KAF6242684.1 hypothetical protein C6988_05685 [Nitrosopumilus sp. b1]